MLDIIQGYLRFFARYEMNTDGLVPRNESNHRILAGGGETSEPHRTAANGNVACILRFQTKLTRDKLYTVVPNREKSFVYTSRNNRMISLLYGSIRFGSARFRRNLTESQHFALGGAQATPNRRIIM